MTTESIIEIKIDDLGRVCVFPEKETFEFIYRAAAEVGWNEKQCFLYTPAKKELSYVQWYGQILGAVLYEYGCQLLIADNTRWTNVPDTLKEEMISVAKLVFK